MEHTVTAPGRTRGFSLVEVLIALVILGFVALGIASLFSHAQLTNASGYQYALLASEARQVLETMHAMSFDAGEMVDTDGVPVEWPNARAGFDIQYLVEDFGLQGWTTVFNPATGDPVDPAAWPAPVAGNPPQLKRITVRVSSDNRLLYGRREFVVSVLKIPDPV